MLLEQHAAYFFRELPRTGCSGAERHSDYTKPAIRETGSHGGPELPEIGVGKYATEGAVHFRVGEVVDVDVDDGRIGLLVGLG